MPALIPGASSRPADVFLPIWKRGQPAALDITVISTLQNLTVAGAASTQGHTLSVARERLFILWPVTQWGVSFFPLVVESLGGWSDESIDIIKSIGRLQGQHLGISPNESTQHLFQRLAVSLWKGNAGLWIRRFPTHSPRSMDRCDC